MTKEIAISQVRAPVQSFSVQDMERMAQAFAASNLFGVKTKDQALALMLVAQAEGRHPASVAQDYDIIGGRPAIKANSALARFQAAGGSIRWTERNDKAAEAEFSHAQGGTLAVRWDMARATKAGLASKDNWKKYPAQMLSARVAAEGVRAVFPACLNGMYVSEEVRDIVDEDGHRQKAPDPKKEVSQELTEDPDQMPAPRGAAADLLAKASEVFSPDEMRKLPAEPTIKQCREIAAEIRRRRVAKVDAEFEASHPSSESAADDDDSDRVVGSEQDGEAA